MNNRILAMLLAIIMIVSIVPVNAGATENLVHAEGCEYRAPCTCESEVAHAFKVGFGGGCEGYPCTMDCANNADSTPTPTPTPVTPGEHTCEDKDYSHLCDVEGCGKVVHAMTKVAAKTPTHGETGNIEYWTCGTCKNFFEDEAGTKKIQDKTSVNLDKVAHTMVWTTTNTTHIYECNGCLYDEITAEPHTFAYSAEQNKEVCDECGYVKDHECSDTSDHACDTCNAPMHGELAAVEAAEATCTEAGRNAYFYCEKCDKAFSDEAGTVEMTWEEVIIPALGHKLNKVEAKDSTCVEQGNMAYYRCGTCNKLYKEEAATTELTEGYVLKELGGHSWSDWQTDNAEGHYRICTVEGCTATNRVYAHTDFTYENGKQTCGVCGYEFDHICADANNNHSCDDCDVALKHDIAWASNAGQHYQYCENEKCFKKTLTGWEVCTDEDKDCVCDDCGYEYPHTWSTEIVSTDPEGHYQVCTNCGAESEKMAHVLGSAVAVDNKTHTRTCTQAGCSYQVTEDHNDGTNSDHKCGSCRAEMVHDWIWDYYSVQHRQKCTVCGTFTEYENHVVEEGDCQCECGYGVPHTWSSEIHYTEEGHFNVCTNCGAESEKMAHDLSFGSAKANDELTHTKTCRLKGCEYQVTEDHNDGTNSDHKCGACRAEMVHDWVWDYGPTSHRQKCETCGKTTDYESHVHEDNDCVCEVCGAEKVHVKDDLTYHGYRSPICEVAGNHGYYTCNTCGNTFTKEDNAYVAYTDYVIPALEHVWGPTQSISTSTYCGDLCHIQSCLRDNCYALNIIEHVDADEDCVCDLSGKLLHSHSLVKNDGQDATCTEPGWEPYFTYMGCGQLVEEIVEIPATGHDETGEWEACEDGKNHALYCLTCEELLETEEHDFTSEAPYCVDCGAAEGLEPVDEVSATCTSTGMKAHWISSITQRRYSDAAGTKYISDVSSLVIPELPHEMAVESSNGTTHVIGCENCAEEYTEACSSEDGNCVCDICETVFAGHTLTAVAGKAPTCTKNGQAEALYCAKCDKYYAAEDGAVLATIEIKPLGHQWQTKWYNDVREGTHSKNCLRSGCGEKISEAHDLAAYDLYSGNLHEWRCSICEYKESELHADSNGDSICDECEHGSNKAVDAGDLSNHRETITIKTDKNASTQEKKNTWWKSFVGKLNPSYVGESQSSSAPSATVENPVPNGSGVSSGTTSGASQNAPAGSTTPSSGTIGAVVNFLMNLLNTLFGI